MKKAIFICLFLVGAVLFGDVQKVHSKAEMQTAVQKILDDAVASGVQTAVQCCVYIDGEKVVDAWAGTYVKGGSRKIDGESLFPIYSTGKGVFVTAAHRLVEMGKLRYDTRIADIWPEFGCNGKENIRLWQVMSHRTGLPAAPPVHRLRDYNNWNTMCRAMSVSVPQCEPGTKTGYLSRSLAWVLGEPMSRVMKKPLRDVIRETVLIPSGTEKQIYFGTDDEAEKRVVTLYPKPGTPVYRGDPETDLMKRIPWYVPMNTPSHRRQCIPSAGGVASARGLAKFYAQLIGSLPGRPALLKPETVAFATKLNRWEKDSILDKSGRWVVFGTGYVLYGPLNDLGQVFGQGGLGGSEAIADVKNRIAVGYTCSDDNHARNLRPAIWKVIGLNVRF